jgi:hypothetical protein
MRVIIDKLAECLAVADRHGDFVLAAALCDAHETAVSRITRPPKAIDELHDK